MQIAVIVSTFERPGHLERCLASLEAQRGVDGNFEVVVTDDGSRDDTLRPVFYSLKNEVLAPQGFTSTKNRRGTMRHGFRHRS